MLKLIKWLIFGKQCLHDYRIDYRFKPFNNYEKHIYICNKCGKITTITLFKSRW